MVAELRLLLGQYNQNMPDMDCFFPLSYVAIKNAETITPIGKVWFEEAGSTMYKLMEALQIEFP